MRQTRFNFFISWTLETSASQISRATYYFFLYLVHLFLFIISNCLLDLFPTAKTLSFICTSKSALFPQFEIHF